MTDERRRKTALRGFAWGALAGAALVALMYVVGPLLGLRPLPQLLSGPFLDLMPGFVFGFLIDTLQHAGKVVEEAGLIVGMVVGLGVLGAAWALTSLRWQTQYSALAFAAIGWLVVVVLVLPLTGIGLLGLNDGLATPLIWGPVRDLRRRAANGRRAGRRDRPRTAATAQHPARDDRGGERRPARGPAGA